MNTTNLKPTLKSDLGSGPFSMSGPAPHMLSCTSLPRRDAIPRLEVVLMDWGDTLMRNHLGLPPDQTISHLTGLPAALDLLR